MQKEQGMVQKELDYTKEYASPPSTPSPAEAA